MNDLPVLNVLEDEKVERCTDYFLNSTIQSFQNHFRSVGETGTE